MPAFSALLSLLRGHAEYGIVVQWIAVALLLWLHPAHWVISVKHPKREEGTWVTWQGRTGAAASGSRGGRFPLSPRVHAMHSLGKRARPRPKAVFRKQRGQPG